MIHLKRLCTSDSCKQERRVHGGIALFVLLIAAVATMAATSSVADGYETLEELVLYVDASRDDDSGNGLSWESAKKTIQAAVDVAPAGATVWVTNGIYVPSPEIVITNDIVVTSVNGAEVTVVKGGNAWQPSRTHGCFRLGDCACVVQGFTIRDGRGSWDNVPYALGEGGGVYCGSSTTPVVSQCIFTENFAEFGAGMFSGTAIDCVFTNNSATDTGSGGGMVGGIAVRCRFFDNRASFGGGGGMHYGTALNCIFIGNIANGGGGMVEGLAVNCTFSGNTAVTGEAMWGGVASNSIAWPDAFHGTTLYSCWTNDPQFVDQTNRDLHLQTNSPCIDAGDNAPLSRQADLDSMVRPLDGDNDGTTLVDIGCYEYLNAIADSDHDIMRDGWELNYGLNPTNAADATLNADGDPFNNREEYIADTNPTDMNDYFRIRGITGSAPLTVSFVSSSNRLYSLIACSNLANGAWANVTGINPRPGVDGPDLICVTNETQAGAFYRLRVELP